MPLFLVFLAIGILFGATNLYNRYKHEVERKPIYTILLVMTWIGCFFWIWELRPAYHGFTIDFILGFFMGLLGLILIVLGSALYVLFTTRLEILRKTTAVFIILLGCVWFLFGIINGATGAFQKALVYKDIKDSIVYISELPESSPVQRMIPRQIAINKTRNMSTISDAMIGQMHYIIEEDGIWMSGGFNPVFWRSFRGKVRNVAFIKVSESGSEPTIKETNFVFGPNLRWADNVFWRLQKRSYWSMYSDPIYVRDSQNPDNIIMLVPTRRPAFCFYSIFPVWRPVFTGVWKIYPDGKMIWVPRDQITSDPDTRGQRVFPEEMARLYGLSVAFSHGIINAFFTHRDQAVLQDLKGERNKLPYLIEINNREPVWFIFLKPYGSSARGLKSMLFIDAVTGSIRQWNASPNTTLIGPQRAIMAVRENHQFRNVTWYTKSSDTTIEGLIVVEALPVFINKSLYWKLTITGSGMNVVTQIVFVDASDPENVIVFNNSDDAYRFIATGAVKGETMEDILPLQTDVADLITKLEAIPDDMRSEFDEQILELLRSLQIYLMRK